MHRLNQTKGNKAMARDQAPIPVPYKQWVELTDQVDVEALKFQVTEGKVEVRRDGAAMPGNQARGWLYLLGLGERGPLSEISEVNTGNRVWAYGLHSSGSIVVVDHA